MAVLTREEVGKLLYLGWDELTVAQKLLRLRCLIGQTFVDRTPPTEETLSRAEAVLELGVLPENGCGVMLDRHGGVILGWGHHPASPWGWNCIRTARRWWRLCSLALLHRVSVPTPQDHSTMRRRRGTR